MMVHLPDALTILIETATRWFDQRLADGGPRYAEYHPEYIIVEPWNAASSVFMMIPALFWFWKLWPAGAKKPMMIFALFMVFLGGLGSTLFHAFRMSPAFLMLDVIPSALLTMGLAVYFWFKILHKWWKVVILLVPLILLRVFLFRDLPQHLAINLSYAFSGLLIVVPLTLYLFLTHFRKMNQVGLMLLFFALALLFRQTDIHSFGFLPQGTHFLWHLFSAMGSYQVLQYLSFTMDYNIESNRPY